MNKEQKISFRKQLLDRVRRRFPNYTVRIEELPELEMSISVGVFSVPKEQVDKVEEYIYSLENEYWNDLELIITPHVCSSAITNKYYPQYCTNWIEDKKNLHYLLVDGEEHDHQYYAKFIKSRPQEGGVPADKGTVGWLQK